MCTILLKYNIFWAIYHTLFKIAAVVNYIRIKQIAANPFAFIWFNPLLSLRRMGKFSLENYFIGCGLIKWRQKIF